tara:strand:+ start:253 stop:1173 length:921 start_codon:yes stop_codon:yes gene_type:complete
MNHKNTYCTIITANYFFYAKALYDSIKKYDVATDFKVLVVDDYPETLFYEAIEIFSLKEMQINLTVEYSLIEKYENDKESNLRWALKPLFLKYLINFKNCEKVLFLDPDLYFYQNPSFLFDKLDTADVIITPHWRSKDPIKDPSNFNSLFTGGLFNAGFFGCNTKSINILDWWLKSCAYKMKKTDGFYVDQAYLNLMPIYFSSQVKIIEHRGCNVSNWNLIECERIVNGGDILINNKYPIIFIHYTNATITMIAKGKDNLLHPFLNKYKNNLLAHNKDFKFTYEKKDSPKKKKSLVSSLKKVFKSN